MGDGGGRYSKKVSGQSKFPGVGGSVRHTVDMERKTICLGWDLKMRLG